MIPQIGGTAQQDAAVAASKGVMGRRLDLRSRKRASVRPDGTAHYRCPECGRETALRPGTPVRPATPVRVWFHCACGTSHAVYLQLRATRAKVDAPGVLACPNSDIRMPILIRDVSRTGALLELEDEKCFTVGDELVVEFDLGAAEATRFVKEVAIRRIDRERVGAEFTNRGSSGDDLSLERMLARYQLGQIQG
jgi:hypothetical protein